MRYLVNGVEADLNPVPGLTVETVGDRVRIPGHGSALVRRAKGKVYVSYAGRTYMVEPVSSRVVPAETKGELHAPIPGVIVEVFVSVGERVNQGDRLMVLEAMKMQQPIVAPFDGEVAFVNVSKGEQVGADAVLAKVVRDA